MNAWLQKYLVFSGQGIVSGKHLHQVVTATSDGAIAAQEAAAYIKALKRQQI